MHSWIFEQLFLFLFVYTFACHAQTVNTVESRFLEPPMETEIGSKNRRWHEITLCLQGIVFDNQESKQKYYGTLVQFFSFHLNGHT